MRSILTSLAVWALATTSAWAGAYNFVVQPIYPPDRAEQVYAPLVDYLNRVTDHDITLVTPRNFHTYWASIRRNDESYHLVFDDAHFTEYRIQRYNYEPLVRTADPTAFSLVAMPQFAEDGLRGLVGRRVVSMPAPSLGFSLFTDWYQNPLQQPNIVSTAIDWYDAVDIVFAAEADAAMVPTWLAERYPNLVSIAATRDFPGSAVSASQAVDADARAQITQALLSLHEDEALFGVLAELTIERFETASAEEYTGFDEMLQKFYGY